MGTVRDVEKDLRRHKRRQLRKARVNRPPPERLTLKCLHCGAPNSVKAKRKNDTIRCPKCHGVWDVSPFLRRESR